MTKTNHSPADKEIRDTLSREPFDTRAVRHYVLREYEQDLRDQHGSDDLPREQVGSVENVLPQVLNQEWKKKFTITSHRANVGLIGNLLPLSAKQNKSVKGQGWAKKRRRFAGSNWQASRTAATRASSAVW